VVVVVCNRPDFAVQYVYQNTIWDAVAVVCSRQIFTGQNRYQNTLGQLSATSGDHWLEEAGAAAAIWLDGRLGSSGEVQPRIGGQISGEGRIGTTQG
jgi:hypothetical protein